MSKDKNQPHPHGPDNAEHEIKKAYNLVIEVGTTFSSGQGTSLSIPGVEIDQVFEYYKRSFNAFRREDRLAAERWARTVKHLARAFWHEAKIHYVDAHSTDLPFLENAREEYELHEHSDTTSDLLNSVADHVPPGSESMPAEMTHYLARAREHLAVLEREDYRHELARVERIKAAHEYGRVLECMALALEAEYRRREAA